jgi:hypothetical protein
VVFTSVLPLARPPLALPRLLGVLREVSAAAASLFLPLPLLVPANLFLPQPLGALTDGLSCPPTLFFPLPLVPPLALARPLPLLEWHVCKPQQRQTHQAVALGIVGSSLLLESKIKNN